MSLQHPPERGPYELPDALREEIFLQVIAPRVLLANEPQRQERPELVLLGGQPGAGKTTASRSFQREFTGRGGIVAVDADELRPYHPAYETLTAERHNVIPDAIHETAGWWYDRAIDYLRARRYNLLLEGGFRDPAAVIQTAEDFAATGYDVRVAAVAVPAALSRLGIIERYAAQLDHTGVGRWVPAARHDENYHGTPDVLQRAQDSPAVHRITVLTRDGRVYDRPTGRWPTTTSPVEVFEEARAEPFTRLQRTALANRLADTLDGLCAAGAGHDELYDMAAAVHDDLTANAALAGQAPGQHGRSVGERLDAALADLDAANTALDASTAPDPELPHGPEPEPGGPEVS